MPSSRKLPLPAGAYSWQFRARFRRNAFGWRSQPAVSRVNEAAAEIKKVARKDPVTAAEGSVLFLEKVSPALESVDGSSGAIGTAVNRAVVALSGIISKAPVDFDTRSVWLDRLWIAYLADAMSYIESLGDRWGELCSTPELASEWGDRLMGSCRAAWSSAARHYFKGTTNCLSSLLAAERYGDVLELLELDPIPMWHYRRYGVAALVALGRKADAIRYAEASRGINDSPVDIARACEEILLSSGLSEDAYQRYGIVANQSGTYLSWFRAVLRKYPGMAASEILGDLVSATPGNEGKWFAAAKDAGMYDEAIALVRTSACAPQTLARAARDFMDTKPEFAMEAGLAAIRWLAEGYGYEVTSYDVLDAYTYTKRAAANAGCAGEALHRIRTMVAKDTSPGGLVARVLGPQLGERAT